MTEQEKIATQQEYDDLQRHLNAVREHGYSVEYNISGSNFTLTIDGKTSSFSEDKVGYENAQSWIGHELKYTLDPHYPEKGQNQAFDALQDMLETIRQNGYSASLETNYYGDSIVLIIDDKSSYHDVNTPKGYEAAKEWIGETIPYVLTSKQQGNEEQVQNNIDKEEENMSQTNQKYSEDYLNKKFKTPVMAAQAVYMATVIKAHENPAFSLFITEEQKQAEIDEFNELLNNPEFTYSDEEVEKMDAPINQWDTVVKEASEKGDKELENFAREMNDHDNERLAFTSEVYRHDYELLNEEKEALEKISEYEQVKEIAHDFTKEDVKELEATLIVERPLSYMVESMKDTVKTIQNSRKMLKDNDKQYRTITEQALGNAKDHVMETADAMQVSVRNSISHAAKLINNAGKSIAKPFIEFGTASLNFLKQAKATIEKGMDCFCEITSFGIYSEVKARNLSQSYLPLKEIQQKMESLKDVHDLCWGKDSDSPAGKFVSFVGDTKAKAEENVQYAIDTVSSFKTAMTERTVRFGKEFAADVIKKRDSAIEAISNKLDTIAMNVAMNKTKLEVKSLMIESSFIEKTANVYERLKTSTTEKIKRLEECEQSIFDHMQEIERQRTIIMEQLIPFQRAKYEPSPELLQAKEELNQITNAVVYNMQYQKVNKMERKEILAFNKQQDVLELSSNKDKQKNEAKLFELNEEFINLIDYKNELLQKIDKQKDKLSSLTETAIGLHQKASDIKMDAHVMSQEMESSDFEMA